MVVNNDVILTKPQKVKIKKHEIKDTLVVYENKKQELIELILLTNSASVSISDVKKKHKTIKSFIDELMEVNNHITTLKQLNIN